jgi:hypothetical protein
MFIGCAESALCTGEGFFSQVRHPPQSGWLDEWGRLKGGCPYG